METTMTTWVWVVSFSVLGTNPEHGIFGMFSNRVECQQALQTRKQEMKANGKEIVGTCFFTQRKTG